MILDFTYEDCFDYVRADAVDIERVRALAESGKRLRVKFGIDPTSPNVHLGRAIPLWRLRAFQELGHEIHLIIGDFTAQIGDTSDKDSDRPALSREQVEANLRDYERQLWMVLNPAKKELVTFHRNSEWLSKISPSMLIELTGLFTVNQFIKRELIARRLEAGNPVSVREMIYPIMQGSDSVQLRSDIEIGGSDQWFNLLTGRTLQEHFKQTPQAVVTNILINGADGEKMSSSRGNVITLNQPSFSLFTQMMQIRDGSMAEYLNAFPRPGRPFTPEELQARFDAGENPRAMKAEMARRMVELLFGDEEGRLCAERWEEELKQVPRDIPEFSLNEHGLGSEAVIGRRNITLVELLVLTSLASSKSDARRLIEQNAIRLNGVTQGKDRLIDVEELPSRLLQAGKHRFVNLVS